MPTDLAGQPEGSSHDALRRLGWRGVAQPVPTPEIDDDARLRSVIQSGSELVAAIGGGAVGLMGGPDWSDGWGRDWSRLDEKDAAGRVSQL
jgi:carbamate kinase